MVLVVIRMTGAGVIAQPLEAAMLRSELDVTRVLDVQVDTLSHQPHPFAKNQQQLALLTKEIL